MKIYLLFNFQSFILNLKSLLFLNIFFYVDITVGIIFFFIIIYCNMNLDWSFVCNCLKCLLILFFFSTFYVSGKCDYHCPNMCGKKYTRKHNLNRHLNYECGVEPRFTCDLCLKKFTYNCGLKAHRFSVHRLFTLGGDSDVVKNDV